MRSDKRQSQLEQEKQRNALPEANLIFQLLQHDKKSIYPFEMISKINVEMTSQQQPYLHMDKKTKHFRPMFGTVKEHFDRKYLVYDKFNNNMDDDLFNMNIYPLAKLKNLKNQDYMINTEKCQSYQSPEENRLVFDSRFESGNLSLAAHHDNTYYLMLHNDVNTSGYTSWFYFRVQNQDKGLYKFAILNYGKAGWQHNNGVGICIKTRQRPWQRSGMNIHCQSNRSLFSKGSLLNFNTLYFEYQFEQDSSEVYFAYGIPYTYNDLRCFLNDIESKNHPHFHRKLAGLSLAGNKLQLISITNFNKMNETNMSAIIFTARSHPGQTVSSWILHHLIKFLISDDPTAETLRNNFVFKIFPMLNPDGVIHGNYRCSLSGRDLNRRWKEPNKQLFPQVYFVKNQIMQIVKKRSIKVFIDLHGHTQKKKVFAYGCNDKLESYRCRLYPYLVSKLTSNFQFKFCNFHIDRSKIGTARVTMFQQVKIPYIYTIQTSQFGTNQGHHSAKVFQDVGESLAIAIKMLFHLKNSQKLIKEINSEEDKFKLIEDNFESELLSDTNLLKIGNQRDSGSDSEPSVDNIDFEKLKRLNEKKNLQINVKATRIKSNPKQNGRIFQSGRKFDKNSTDFKMNRPRTTQNLASRQIKSQKTNKIFISSPSQTSYRVEKSRNASEMKHKLQPKTQRKNSQSYPNRQTETVNFINLSLSVYDDINGLQQKSCKLGLAPYSYKFNEDQTYRRLKISNRNFYIFRRRK